MTLLSTDIEGSTRRWEADPDVMRVALENHNKVLRNAVEASDGKGFNHTATGCAQCSRRLVRPSTPQDESSGY